MHINQCITIRLKYAHNSADIGNDRYTYVQNRILLKLSVIKKNARLKFAPYPPPPNPKNVPTTLCIGYIT